MKINWVPKEWAVEVWSADKCVCLYAKICQSLDGRFVVDPDKKVLPRLGFRREHHTFEHDQDTLRPRTRHIIGWRLWVPYLMLWYIKNDRDEIVITLPSEDDTIH